MATFNVGFSVKSYWYEDIQATSAAEVKEIIRKRTEGNEDEAVSIPGIEEIRCLECGNDGNFDSAYEHREDCSLHPEYKRKRMERILCDDCALIQ